MLAHYTLYITYTCIHYIDFIVRSYLSHEKFRNLSLRLLAG